MLLRFKLHEIRLGRWTHLLLPKLNESQIQWLTRKLTKERFKVEERSILVARRKAVRIHINPSGHCWSSSDPGDFVVPLIPELLRLPKQNVPLAELIGLYFKAKRLRRETIVRLTTRMESGPDWVGLRSSGQCALSPDEKVVASMLIRSASEGCSLFTDFPRKLGGVRIVGNKQYHESFLEPEEALATLREVGRNQPRNSYLPGDGLLRLRAFVPPLSSSLRTISRELGEWCYFMPA
jgi:hypothetical protein